MTSGPSAREWITDRIHLILSNNDRRVYLKLTAAAEEAVLDGMGAPAPGRDDYAEMIAGRGKFTRDDYATVVGHYVTDAIRDALEKASLPGPWGILLEDLLDLGDSVQRRMIGYDWLPEIDDIAWPDSDDENDEDNEGEA